MAEKTETKIKGVMGFIEKDGKFLFGIESKNSSIQGKWRLLGGKLEHGEDSEQAMIRECMEEANIKVEVKKFIGDVTIAQKELTIDLCHTKWISGDPIPKLNEVGELKWVTLEEARLLDKDNVSEIALKLFEETLPEQRD